MRDRGGDGAPLLLLHGGGDRKETWDAIAPQLAQDFRVVAFDAAGHGDSPIPDAVGVDMPLDEIDEVCDATGLDSPVLVGHSMGGSVALRYAADRGARGLVAVDGAWAPWGPRRRDPDELRSSLLAAGYDEEHAAYYVRIAEVGDELRAVHPDRWYERLTCPALLLCATRGTVADQRDYIDALPQRFPAVTVEWVDSGHGIHEEHPQLVVDRVRSFARALRGA